MRRPQMAPMGARTSTADPVKAAALAARAEGKHPRAVLKAVEEARLGVFRAECEDRAAIRTDLIGYLTGGKNWPTQKVDPKLQRDLEPGWLFPYVVQYDSMIWARWQYWGQIAETGRLPETPIPPIEWEQTAHPRTRKMLETCLNAIPGYGEWLGWSASTYFDYFLDWLLWGLGHNREEPVEPAGCEGASMRLYQLFQAGAMQIWPYDYFGDMMAEARFGRHNGFYPTPMNVVQMMTMMNFGPLGGEDLRLKTVMDPCLGTGRMLLAASNYSLLLYGQDIDSTVLKAALVNAALYAPWMYTPLRHIDPRPQTALPSVGETLTRKVGKEILL